MGRRLERHVDWDLADRIAASGPVKKQPKTKSSKEPRVAASYRGARRNAFRGSVWAGASAHREHSFAKLLNRSSNWPRAKSYEHAREIGPSSEVVR